MKKGKVYILILKRNLDRKRKNEQKIKGYADMSPGHRTNFSNQGQKIWKFFMKEIGGLLKIQN